MGMIIPTRAQGEQDAREKRDLADRLILNDTEYRKRFEGAVDYVPEPALTREQAEQQIKNFDTGGNKPINEWRAGNQAGVVAVQADETRQRGVRDAEMRTQAMRETAAAQMRAIEAGASSAEGSGSTGGKADVYLTGSGNPEAANDDEEVRKRRRSFSSAQSGINL